MKRYISPRILALIIVGFYFLGIGNAFPKESGIATANQQQASPTVSGITSGRAKALVGTGFGLISLIFGWRAKLRSKQGIEKARSGAMTSLTLGIIAIILSAWHL